MQVKQITVEIMRTYNLGNYNNIKPSVSVLVHLDEGDDPETVIAETSRMALRQIERAAKQNVTDQEDDLPF